MRITKATVDGAWRRRRPDFRLTIRDAECRGLALVVNPTGMTWTVSYKPRGLDSRTGKRPSTREVTLGTPATHSPEQARTAANKVKGEAKGGADPAKDRRVAIAKAARDRAATVARLVQEYTTALPNRPKMRGTGTLSARALEEETRNVRLAVATMKVEERSISDVTEADVRALLTKEAKRPATARYRFGALSRFLEWCREEGLITVNPCLAIGKNRRPRPAKPRTHHLTIPDLASLWHATAAAETDASESDFGSVHRDYVRFLLSVPARRVEATRLEWQYLDLETASWTMSGKLTKNGDPFRVPLPSIALGILRERHRAMGKPRAGLVFPSPKAGKALTTFSAMKAAMDKASGLTGWTWHDFRRSFVTVLAEHGVAEAVADAMLNHRQAATRGGVLGVYQQARRIPEQEAAMRRWNELLVAAVEGRTLGEGVVFPLAKSTR
ncbi:tyrosine-type recombinase/integrase [Muricoccus vinaceus]|uniref:Tyrosine-type recombinase/integrase n=1 Tax=Muricoccus vinaceus TaxID=424704 RepID=A0ABV6IZ94_9PROT